MWRPDRHMKHLCKSVALALEITEIIAAPIKMSFAHLFTRSILKKKVYKETFKTRYFKTSYFDEA